MVRKESRKLGRSGRRLCVRRGNRAVATIFLSVWPGISSRASASQPTRTVGDAKQCAACRIHLTRVMVLGAESDSDHFTRPTSVTVDSRGRVFLVDQVQGGRVMAYDQEGRFLKLLARRGLGPGELSRVQALAIDAADTIHVFAQSHSVWDPNLTFVRARALATVGHVNSALLVSGGLAVIQGEISTPDAVGQPLHVLDGTNTVLRSFGLNPGAPYEADPWLSRRAVALSRDGSVWSVPPNNYRMERWSLEGTLAAAVLRRARWFEPWAHFDGLVDLQRPPARITAIHEDSLGRVWILTLVASVDWAPTRRPSGMIETETRPRTLGEVARLTDSIIEVLDPVRGQLLVSERLRGLFDGFAGKDLIVQLSETDDGDVRVTLWKLSISENGR
jgi:hypothetical protein